MAELSNQVFDRLEREYALRDALDADWAARPVALAPRDGRMTLVLDDPGGVPLDRLLGRPLDVAEFLRLAIPIARAIRRMHGRGLIHKDIKPANLLVDAEGGRAWLTGFGIASRLAREHRVPEPPEVIAGTLAYMAPEQTGRMNRSVDSRSDLYALGVTFYEMLTGALPFTAADPMEWVHCHIARQPAPPEERVAGIPGPLSALVLKLMAKTAEDRYQTAAGVEADLRRCLAGREASGRIDPFPLGTQDASDRLVIPERLYGREREIDELLASFERVVERGTPELVLISGYSGIGKSSVVNELHKALVPSRGRFASGKFDQYKRDIPYATLAEAVQSLVRHILGKSDVEVNEWRNALREALGQNGQVIVNLVPELGMVIGAQPPVPELAPREAQNRFQLVFRRLIGVFARRDHPLALFLDDLQWLDAATLTLLADLVTRPEVGHLLLVGAYRDNEVGPSHPLRQMLETVRNAGARVPEIVLSPLTGADVGRFVADALHCEAEHARPLAELVHEKTGGNPFFAIQFLTELAEEKLLVFDSGRWTWDVGRIRGKGYTDNVVDLMVGKLNRLPVDTLEALKQLACLGNAAETAALATVRGEPEQATREALWEAVRAGLVFQPDGACKFLHDRIQQAAYSLIPLEERAELHLRIGRALFPGMTADDLFDVANQFNRGAALLTDPAEKARVAALDLRAGQKAKASAAYASARAYLAAGMDLLDEAAWSGRYELIFRLRLERAECEYLCGNFERAEQLIAELLERAASNVDRAAVYQVKLLLHTLKSENLEAVTSGLACLRLFDIDLPAHPTFEQVQAEYDSVWQTLAGRATESLIDLPVMTDPELQAAVQILSVVGPPAYFTDLHLFCLIACRTVKIAMQNGISDASALGFALLGFISGPVFHRYREGWRFARLACDLVAKHRFVANQPKVDHATGTVAYWTQPVGTAIEFMRETFRSAVETGDLTFACYGLHQIIPGLLLRSDPLDAVWRESELALDFAREARYADAADIIRSQQRFIAALQGRGPPFDEGAFEARLTADRMPFMVCFHWILELKARFLSGDYAGALAAADKAKPLLQAATAQIQLLDYVAFSALALAALDRREPLAPYREQLREWAETYPPTFAGTHALVSAEIARIEGRDAEAMRLYEEAIQSARKHGLAQDEGLAQEVSARFYAARGLETIAHGCLRSARNCYLRWGAHGKVRQLEAAHPRLREDRAPSGVTIGAPVEQLDIGAVVKASQAISGEIVLDRLIETLMTIVLQHAGAERGLLILVRGDTLQVEAEAKTERKTVAVARRQEAVTPAALPESLLRAVVRTRESVILDDASARNPFSADEYIARKHARSILCLPLLKQVTLVGTLYLENNLAPHVFTPARLGVLNLLSSQAAISLENARLYAELIAENRSRVIVERALGTSEERWRNLFETAPFGLVLAGPDGRYFAANPSFQRMTGYSEAELRGLTATDITWEEDRAATASILEAFVAGDHSPRRWEKRFRRKDGAPVWVEVSTFLVTVEGDPPLFAGIALDLTERKRAEQELRDAQADLAHMARLTTMGELVASLAHEISQPLAGIATNAGAGLRWVGQDPPDLDETRAAFSRIVRDAARAGEVMRGLRALARKTGPELASVDIDDAIHEVLALTRSEMQRHGVVVHTRLQSGDRPVLADRVQLQQVLMNLIVNAIDAMKAVEGRARVLSISSEPAEPDGVLVGVSDTGPGIDPGTADRIFQPFVTTKRQGMGMGLSICRSIVEAHGGRLWVSAAVPSGALFRFTIPAAPRPSSDPT